MCNYSFGTGGVWMHSHCRKRLSLLLRSVADDPKTTKTREKRSGADGAGGSSTTKKKQRSVGDDSPPGTPREVGLSKFVPIPL